MLILLVSLLHILWGIAVLLNGGPIGVSATWAFTQIVGKEHFYLRALTYITAGILPVLMWLKPGTCLGMVSVFPQQVLVMLSAVSALAAILNGHYADGVMRPYTFIAMDQSIFIILAILHAETCIDVWKK